MNGTDPYERQLNRIPNETPPQLPDREGSPFAGRGDPSQSATSVKPSVSSPRGVAWVRPTELAMRVSSSAASRGINLQTALSAQARRAPVVITRASRHTARSSITRPQLATPEGPGL